MTERTSLASVEAEQRKIGLEAMDSYKINGAAAILCLAALWWDASRIGAGAFLALIALYNFGILWHNKSRLDRAYDRDPDRPPPARVDIVQEYEV
jgi:hypothetical protein